MKAVTAVLTSSAIVLSTVIGMAAAATLITYFTIAAERREDPWVLVFPAFLVFGSCIIVVWCLYVRRQ